MVRHSIMIGGGGVFKKQDLTGNGCIIRRGIMDCSSAVGYNTPGIIKYPFWQMTVKNKKAVYACINFGEAVCPKEIREQAICIDGDIGEVLAGLSND